MIVRDDVVWAYRMILGREVESSAIVDFWLGYAATRDELRLALLQSAEFGNSRVNGSSLPTAAAAFGLVFGRPPSDEETRLVEAQIVRLGPQSPHTMLRAAAGAFGRTEYPTPVLVRMSDEDFMIADLPDGGGRIVLDRGDWSVSPVISESGDYEPHVGQFIAATVEPGMIAVDAGANVGFHTLMLAKPPELRTRFMQSSQTRKTVGSFIARSPRTASSTSNYSRSRSRIGRAASPFRPRSAAMAVS